MMAASTLINSPMTPVWAALADTAVQHQYVRPAVHDGLSLTLRQCRHPVIEQTTTDARFVPNDVTLENLDTIGAIEVAEGLPHPMLDGVWAKKSPRATRPGSPGRARATPP